MKPDEVEQNEINNLHRAVLVETSSGRELLAFLLGDMGVFDDDLTDPSEVAVANYGRRLLQNCGVINTHIDSLDDIYAKGKRRKRLEEVTNALANIPMEGKQNE